MKSAIYIVGVHLVIGISVILMSLEKIGFSIWFWLVGVFFFILSIHYMKKGE